MLHFQVKLLTGLLFLLWFIHTLKSNCSLCIFCLCHPRHINLTTSAFTDKGSYSYNSGKSPLHLQVVLLYGVFSCPLQWCILMPWFSTPFSMKCACFCYLTWISVWGAGVNLTPLVWNPLRVSDTCKLQGNRFRTQWSLPLCVFTCELSHNPSLQPTTILVLVMT